MKATLRPIIPAFAFGIIFLFASCEKSEDPMPRFQHTAFCAVDGIQYKLYEDNSVSGSNNDAYIFDTSNNSLIIHFANACFF
jgi:hypothetical protein